MWWVEVGDGPTVDCLVAFDNPAGTAKWWGAYGWLSRLPAGARVVAWSSGGHGTAVAVAAAELGLQATVAVPEGAAGWRKDAIVEAGARLVTAGTLEEAREEVLEWPGVPVPGFDDLAMLVEHGRLWGSVRSEVAVFVPVGGGGLAASAVLVLGRGRVVGVQHAGAESLEVSMGAGIPVRMPCGVGVPVAVRVPTVGRVPFGILHAAGVRVVTVTADEVEGALGVLRRVGVDAEPAGAMAVAAALREGGVALVSGGSRSDS